MALTNKLSNIATAIREKTGTTELMTLDEMPTAIAGISGGGSGGECTKHHIPDEALVISGNCQYRFSNGGWDWFIKECGSEITTKDITNAMNMFSNSKVEEIPFDISFDNSTYRDFSFMFTNCKNLRNIGTLKNMYPSNIGNLFTGCYNLRHLPEFENLNMSRIYSYKYSSISNLFNNCYSLRSIPESLLKQLYTPSATASYYTIFSDSFNSCYSLDEIRGLNPQTGTLTSNAFGTNLFLNCGHLKDVIFAMQDDGTPYKCNWKSQTIDMSTRVGYTEAYFYPYNYNSGLTKATQVTDDASYQALKDNPDWWTVKVEYSRYNHDSAVNTINSLPDTSEYLASAGGTNTIKFTGAAGSATDGGAINTLTPEEISIAAAKGWTVTLV